MLLDSHVLLWLVSGDTRLGGVAKQEMAKQQCYFSAASIWEFRIKQALGKIVLPEHFANELVNSGLKELPVTAQHADHVDEVKIPQRDPYDRLLLAQSAVEGLVFLTADRKTLSLQLPAVLDARL